MSEVPLYQTPGAALKGLGDSPRLSPLRFDHLSDHRLRALRARERQVGILLARRVDHLPAPLSMIARIGFGAWGPLHRNVQRFRGGLEFKAHRLCVSLDSRLESNKERDPGFQGARDSPP